MTLSELQSISAACETDAEFMAHRGIREVYWKAINPGRKHHHKFYRHKMNERIDDDSCAHKCICGLEVDDRVVGPLRLLTGCAVPDPIESSSLADAVEAMRVKVAEKQSRHYMIDHVLREFLRVSNKHGNVWQLAVEMRSRDRFLIFSAALGAVSL